jgi:Fur family transcriptional regulator, ferric uptake regulator
VSVDEAERLHREASQRLAALDQRYTSSRRALVTAIAGAGRPVTMPEILGSAKGVPQSSAYRNLTVLCEAGVARRLAGTDDVGRFELAEDLTGHHHHHLVCSACGVVADVPTSARLEKALDQAARLAAEETGFQVTDHRIDLEGICPNCRQADPGALLRP